MYKKERQRDSRPMTKDKIKAICYQKRQKLKDAAICLQHYGSPAMELAMFVLELPTTQQRHCYAEVWKVSHGSLLLQRLPGGGLAYAQTEMQRRRRIGTPKPADVCPEFLSNRDAGIRGHDPRASMHRGPLRDSVIRPLSLH